MPFSTFALTPKRSGLNSYGPSYGGEEMDSRVKKLMIWTM